MQEIFEYNKAAKPINPNCFFWHSVKISLRSLFCIHYSFQKPFFFLARCQTIKEILRIVYSVICRKS